MTQLAPMVIRVGYDDVPSSRVIILMYRQIEKTERLKIPKSGSVIYIQREDGWQMLPPDAPVVGGGFEIRLEPEPKGNLTEWWIDRLHHGGGAIQWYRVPALTP